MFECNNIGGKIVFSEDGAPLVIPDSEIFYLAQSKSFSGNRFLSARAAEVGLSITTVGATSTIEPMARPRGGIWNPVQVTQRWVDDGTKVAYIPGPFIDSLAVKLADVGFGFFQIPFRDVPYLLSQISDEYAVEFNEPVWPERDIEQQELDAESHPLSVKLHSYQEWCVQKMAVFCNAGLGAILADEMGLGKTVQAIALAAKVVEKSGSILIVVPPVLIPNWRRELARFCPSMRVGVMHRPSGQDVFPDEYNQFDVVITSYSTLTGSRGDLELLNTKTWELVVIDEAQFIKNPDAQRALAVKRLNRVASLALSGTPVENSPLDIWSLAEFIFPSLLGARSDFETGLQVSPVALERVSKLLKPLMIRRTLEEVSADLTLPERIEKVDYLEMTREMARHQDELIQGHGDSRSKFHELTMLSAGARHDSLLTFMESSKYQRLEMLLENAFAVNERVIVFAIYRNCLDQLMQATLMRYPDAYCGMIRGDSGTPEQRQQIVDDFSNSKRAVLFLNPEAAGFGLNITSANHVIHFHPLWNPAKTDQATKRAHRPGQTKPTLVHHFIYENSIEEAIWERTEAKRNLAAEILESGTSNESPASFEEVLATVRGYQN